MIITILEILAVLAVAGFLLENAGEFMAEHAAIFKPLWYFLATYVLFCIHPILGLACGFYAVVGLACEYWVS